MYEGFRIKEGLAILTIVGLGSVSLTGCGLSEHGSWKIGVTCPAPEEKIQINDIEQEHDFKGEAAVLVSCNQGVVTEAPAHIRLLRGQGEASPPAPINPNEKIVHVYYTYEGGLFAPGEQRNPRVDFSTIPDQDTGEQLGLISISGVSHIDSAVANP